MKYVYLVFYYDYYGLLEARLYNNSTEVISNIAGLSQTDCSVKAIYKVSETGLSTPMTIVFKDGGLKLEEGLNIQY